MGLPEHGVVVMDGAAHYRESERLIASLTRPDGGLRGLLSTTSAQTLALAQVHATLALAGATAMAAVDDMHYEDFTAWDDVAGRPLVMEEEPKK